MCGNFLTTMPRLPVTNFVGGSPTPGELTVDGSGQAHGGVMRNDAGEVHGTQDDTLLGRSDSKAPEKN